MVRVEAYRAEHFNGVEALWREAFPDDPPWNTAAVAIPAKLAVQPDLFIVALDQDRVVGSIMAGYDGHRGWLYAAAVLTPHRGTGLAPGWWVKRSGGFGGWDARRSICRCGPTTPG